MQDPLSALCWCYSIPSPTSQFVCFLKHGNFLIFLLADRITTRMKHKRRICQDYYSNKIRDPQKGIFFLRCINITAWLRLEIRVSLSNTLFTIGKNNSLVFKGNRFFLCSGLRCQESSCIVRFIFRRQKTLLNLSTELGSSETQFKVPNYLFYLYIHFLHITMK